MEKLNKDHKIIKEIESINKKKNCFKNVKKKKKKKKRDLRKN